MAKIDPSSPAVEIRRAALDEIVGLRHVALREGLPRESALFDGDEAPTARHYAVVQDGRVVGCATLHQHEWDGQPAWQLRGMATAAGFRVRGVGRAILRFLEADLLADVTPPVQLWCNARTPAVGFYETLGWAVRSEPFEIPTAGPHVKMTKRLGAAARMGADR